MKLIIDEQFEGYLPRLTAQELLLLELSIVSEGMKTPIETWNGIVVDGHHRYEIAERYGIQYGQMPHGIL